MSTPGAGGADQNPITSDHIINYTRIDQGVDFQGTGPITAMNKAQIMEVIPGPGSTSGWPGFGTTQKGTWISYKLLEGPHAGKVVYVAEDVHPAAGLRKGQTVEAGQHIADQVFTGTGIETGWADPTGVRPLSQLPDAGGITGADLPAGGTLVGRDFENWLNKLGVAKANNYDNKSTGGKLPSGFDNPATNPVDATTPSGGGGLGGIINIPPDITSFFKQANTFVTAIMWINKPQNWVRIVACLAGVALLLFAIHALYAAGTGQPLVNAPKSIPVPVPV